MSFIINVKNTAIKKFEKYHILEKFWASLSNTAVKTIPTKVRVISLKSFSMKGKIPFWYFFVFFANKSIRKKIKISIFAAAKYLVSKKIFTSTHSIGMNSAVFSLRWNARIDDAYNIIAQIILLKAI